MTHVMSSLADQDARSLSLTTRDRSLLVEAGAGSGKTAIMAGRIVMMLSEGVPAKSIAAVTFTELAASELLIRIRKFISQLLSDDIPPELSLVIPDKLDEKLKNNLRLANESIDEITCTTIHGFCQRLIKPYPVEANIDPGATILDSGEADLAFQEILDDWLRKRLSCDDASLIAAMLRYNAVDTVKTIESVLQQLRRRRSIQPPETQPITPLLEKFHQAVEAFTAAVAGVNLREAETSDIDDNFRKLAQDFPRSASPENPESIVRILTAEPDGSLLTDEGTFYQYRKGTKWKAAAQAVGLTQAEGGRISDRIKPLYEAVTTSFNAARAQAASITLSLLIEEVRPVIQLFSNYKRSVARLDFDDLIFAARDLLRNHDEVRKRLAERYRNILVDEFQDTDPLQSEIFWRLCGEQIDDASSQDWRKLKIRAGSLFLVGDPKQAIYRFRGADVAAYVEARDALSLQEDGEIISISTNFRSMEPILEFVNARFEAVLTQERQPGFIALNAYHRDHQDRPCVVAVDVNVPDIEGKKDAENIRDSEADTIAQMCVRLIGQHQICDHKNHEMRACRAGDIALLAPSGNDLWRYESALEKLGIPVATQAGKGLYQRQEIQDLIALTRVLADGRDGVALGALLRGPLVGMSEEDLLDIVWELPRNEKDPESLTTLNLYIDPAAIKNPYARDVVERLKSLRKSANSVTPHMILSQAIDFLRVRPILSLRHGMQSERALSNVDLYLSFTRPYATRGLRAFSEAMTLAWEEESRQAEGRPDAQEEAVALYTMHSSKGLEWPIVIPINTSTQIKAAETQVLQRENNRFYRPIFKIEPDGFGAIREAEKDELGRERVRLWYVATTRAKELLILPRINKTPAKNSWISLVDLGLEDLPALDLSEFPMDVGSQKTESENMQTREIFAEEAGKIFQLRHQLNWVAPSRHEDNETATLSEEPVIGLEDLEGLDAQERETTEIQGSTRRGVIIHKILEEVLTGEVSDTEEALKRRAGELIISLGEQPEDQAGKGLNVNEIAESCARALNLAEIKALRGETLIPEVSIYASDAKKALEQITRGYADAIYYSDGKPDIVIDWKSDVQPDAKIIEAYKSQVRSYLTAVGANSGLLVFVTSGKVVNVSV